MPSADTPSADAEPPMMSLRRAMTPRAESRYAERRADAITPPAEPPMALIMPADAERRHYATRCRADITPLPPHLLLMPPRALLPRCRHELMTPTPPPSAAMSAIPRCRAAADYEPSDARR